MIASDGTVGLRRRNAEQEEDEELFLREHCESVETELEERSARQSDAFPLGAPVPRGEMDMNRQWQRQLEILQELQKVHGSETLEKAVRRRLHRAQTRSLELATRLQDRGTYPQEYWQSEMDRTILTKILDDWWDWHGTVPLHQRSDTSDRSDVG